MEQLLETTDASIYNQLISQIYLKGKKELEYLFPEIGIAEYMLLHIIAHIDDCKEDKKGIVYLKELAKSMEMTLGQASQLAQIMSDKGLIEWTHDPLEASEGTYLKISVTGEQLLQEQGKHLKEYFDYIRKEISTDKLFFTLQTIMEIRNVLSKMKENEDV